MAVMLTAALTTIAAFAHYSIYSLNGHVQVKHAGKIGEAAVGQELGAADLILIGEGESVEILDSRDSKIYKADKPGEYTPTQVMLAARRQASSNSGAINSKLRMGKSNKPQSMVYIEKGKVTRSLTVFDPASENIQVDPQKLGEFIGSTIRCYNNGMHEPFPIEVRHDSIEGSGLRFEMRNTMEHPVYFNVLKIDTLHPDSVEISEIGQPVGCYVVLPGQYIMRAQPDGLGNNERHFIVMTHYYFDLDEVIDAVREAMRRPEPTADGEAEYPVYLQFL